MTGSNYGSSMSREELAEMPLDDLIADLTAPSHISERVYAGVDHSLKREKQRMKNKRPKIEDWDE